MSRLPPALGIAPMAGRQQAVSKQQQAFEQDNGRIIESVYLSSRESIDASLQGGDLSLGIVTCWHPKSPIIAVASSTAVVEYDAISGCRRNYVESQGSPIKLRYTPNGSHLVLLTKERNITAWSTASWRRHTLLIADAKYANRPLVSGLLAITAGQHPIVLYSPVGKATLRTIHINSIRNKSGKFEKEHLPGYKLKTDNKKSIVALATHPTDKAILFLVLVDGSFLVCGLHDGTMSALCGIGIPFDATRERIQLHAVQHPSIPRETLILVEAERSGLTVLTIHGRNEARIVGTLSFGAGGLLCGTGLLHKSGLLMSAVRHAGGNIGFRSWRVHAADGRHTMLLPVSVSPGSIWDALQSSSSANSSALSEVVGEAIVAGMLVHGPSGHLGFWTTTPDESGAAHFRLPLLSAVDGEDPVEGLGAAKCLQLNTGLSFWTTADSGQDVVSKLHFPRYTYLINGNTISSYDVAHGLLATFMSPPTVNSAGQERSLSRAAYSSKQGIWLIFFRISSTREGALLEPGHYEAMALPDHEAAVASSFQWAAPARDGVFVGNRDELTVLLSNSGQLIAIFETAKLSSPNARASFVSELRGGSDSNAAATRLFDGPPCHIPAPPEPRPDICSMDDDDGNETDDEAEAALREWEEKEARRREAPKKVMVLFADNALMLVDVSQHGFASLAAPASSQYYYYHQQQHSTAAAATSSSASAQSRPSIQLMQSETVIQVSWQHLIDHGDLDTYHAGCIGASTACPCVAAVLTTQRILLVSHTLTLLAAATFPSDAGCPTSCMWVGPALLVTTSTNQVFHAGWNGDLSHVTSLLQGPPATLVAALADRLVVAARGNGSGLLPGRAEAASRGFEVLPCMLAAWVGLATRGILPGGNARARRALRALIASYDASQLPVAILEAMARAGFVDVASAVAARSELSTLTPERKACFAAAAGDWNGILELMMDELDARDRQLARGAGIESMGFLTGRDGGGWQPPPPPGSPLYNKVVAVARACEAYGKFIEARALFERVGAWNELFALCIFQADFTAVQSYARKAGPEWQGLADQLLAVNEDAFRRSAGAGSGRAMYGGRPNADNWGVSIGFDTKSDRYLGNNGTTSDSREDGEEDNGDNVGLSATQSVARGGESDIDIELELDVAPAGRFPFMEASLNVSLVAAATGTAAAARSMHNKKGATNGSKAPDARKETDKEASNKEKDEEEEGEPIAFLDLTSLDAYLGIAGASVLKSARPATMPSSAPQTTPAGNVIAPAAAAAGLATAESALLQVDTSSVSAPDSEADALAAITRGETPSQAAARAAYQRDLLLDDDDFFSSDEEESTSGGVKQGGGALTSSPGSIVSVSSSSRFMINIKSSEDTPRSSTDGATLRAAASNLRLGGLPSSASGGRHKEQSAVSPESARSHPSDFDAANAPSTPSSLASMDAFSALISVPSIATPPPAQLPHLPREPSADDDPFLAFIQQKGIEGDEAVEATENKPAMSSKDPFAGLPGLPPTLAQSAAAAVDAGPSPGSAPPLAGVKPGNSTPIPENLGFSGVPMRPQPAAPVPHSDLLAGWDEFESLFGGGGGRETGPAGAATPGVVPGGQHQAVQQETAPPALDVNTTSQQQQQEQHPPSRKKIDPPPALKKSYKTGLDAFKKGQWAKAADALSSILQNSNPGDAAVAPFTRQCCREYAAMVLIQRAASAPPSAASRLSRYAAALSLGQEQRAVAMAFAVEANMAAGNYGWASERVMELIVLSSEGGVQGLSGMDLASLQDKLSACDRANGSNATMNDGDDDVESFSVIIESCSSKEDVDELLRNLTQQQ